MDIFIKKEICRDLGQAMDREWLETNGLGGFACSTIIGMNTPAVPRFAHSRTK